MPLWSLEQSTTTQPNLVTKSVCTMNITEAHRPAALMPAVAQINSAVICKASDCPSPFEVRLFGNFALLNPFCQNQKAFRNRRFWLDSRLESLAELWPDFNRLQSKEQGRISSRRSRLCANGKSLEEFIDVN